MTWLLADPYMLLILGALAVLWLIIAAIATACVISASALQRRRDSDMEALINATWEAPDHVPADWVKEHGR